MSGAAVAGVLPGRHEPDRRRLGGPHHLRDQFQDLVTKDPMISDEPCRFSCPCGVDHGRLIEDRGSFSDQDGRDDWRRRRLRGRAHRGERRRRWVGRCRLVSFSQLLSAFLLLCFSLSSLLLHLSSSNFSSWPMSTGNKPPPTTAPPSRARLNFVHRICLSGDSSEIAGLPGKSRRRRR